MAAQAVRLSIAIMTHPTRVAAAEELAERLGGASVVLDPDPGDEPTALKTSAHAWAAVAPGATHHMVVQDDIVPAASFFERLRRGAELFPDAALACYANWNSRNAAAMRLAAAAGATWVEEMGVEYFPTLAVVLPKSRIPDYVEYSRNFRWWHEDDQMIREFLTTRDIPAYVSVPCLVQHGEMDSVAGNGWHGLRRAACFRSDEVYDPDYEALAYGMDFVPLFGRNRGYALVRIEHQGRQEWLKRPAAELWEPLSLDPVAVGEAGRRVIAADPGLTAVRDELGDVFLDGLWSTAVALGAAVRVGRVPVKLLSGAAVRPGPATLVRTALQTLAAGGATWTPLPVPFVATWAGQTTEIAERGYQAGLDGI